ncbi:Ig-like domain-containing protein [[Clostridium] polysaccharolyticum]|uniref:Ig-like domain (Group 2) n=1 Tax=[Clostridium] polysaccharolyticum TaxID=29364 RepID=A0A1I0AE71_9FIRM|nr:Ig-like domain-containing protein [[Clostridium] polysaccharolyticum]SES91550.1 Ig-like domain (group 2) [[Clostridium] polysaccharolyticum]
MKKNGCLVVVNVLYYLALFLLITTLILPHTAIFYSWRIFDPYTKRANTKTVYMMPGERYQIHLFKINKSARYESSDMKVADVMDMGVITAFRPGKTIISIKQNQEIYKYRIYVVKLNKKKLILRNGSIRKLRLKGRQSGVRWKSTNRKVVTVSRYGWVKGKEKGKAYVVASVGGIKVRCKVFVR